MPLVQQYSSGANEFTPCFSQPLVFCIVFYRSLSFLSFFFGHHIIYPSIYGFWLRFCPLSERKPCGFDIWLTNKSIGGCSYKEVFVFWEKECWCFSQSDHNWSSSYIFISQWNKNHVKSIFSSNFREKNWDWNVTRGSVHLATRFQRRRLFRNQPIRNKNWLWRPCLLTNRNEMNNLYREPSIDASYQVSVHLAKWLQRRRFF